MEAIETVFDAISSNKIIAGFLLLGSLIAAFKEVPFIKSKLQIKVRLPVWALLLIVILACAVTSKFSTNRPKIYTNPNQLEFVRDKSFSHEQFLVDGKNVERCKFKNTQWVFEGYNVCYLHDIDFDTATCDIVLSGPAEHTLDFLTQMYQEPLMREYVEGTIRNIRRGKKLIEPNFKKRY